MERKQLEQWVNQVYDIHIPRWDELPEFDLYMDQVITVLDRYLWFLLPMDYGRLVTPSMINNYVKLKLLPKPYKKQYNRYHLASLIAITILKQVLTIKEVKDGILKQVEVEGDGKAYDNFCYEQEMAIKQVCSLIDERKPLIQQDKIDDEHHVALKMTTRAFASKLLAVHLVSR